MNTSEKLQRVLIALIAICTFQSSVFGQTQFWSDTFEDAGAPSSATRTPENDTGSGCYPCTSYFTRADNTEITTTFGGFDMMEGTKFWASMDHLSPFGPGNEEQEIEWTGIDITGKGDLTFSGLFGANSDNAGFESASFGFPDTDYIIVEYSIDGGIYAPLIRFFPNDGTAKQLAEDTNDDGVGDGPVLIPSMAEFSKSIPGSGTSLSLKIRIYTNDLEEEIGFDNFQLFETVLAIDNITLSVNRGESSVDLTWQTEGTTENEKFVLQRSSDGTNFMNIGETMVNPETNLFRWSDEGFQDGQTWYRVAAQSQNGNLVLSNTVHLDEYIQPLTLEVPNPVRAGEMLPIMIIGSEQQSGYCTMMNMNGTEVASISVETNIQNSMDISTLASGTYFLIANIQNQRINKMVIIY